MEEIKVTFRNSARLSEERLQSLPATVEDAYEKILQRCVRRSKKKVTTILRIIVDARRPLKIGEMAIAFGVATSPDLKSKMKPGISQE